MTDFQLINAGTHLTAWEMCRGFLRYMPGFDTRWSPIFNEVDAVMKAAEVQLESSRSKKSREVAHKHKRDNLALFYRFLSQETAATDYPDVPVGKVDRLIERTDVIELRLRDLLQNNGDLATKTTKDFVATVHREIALLDKKRVEVLGQGVGLQAVLWRWLMHFAIWRRNNRVTVELQEALIEKTLKATGGNSTWPSDKPTMFGLANLGKLRRIAALAELPELLDQTVRQRAQPLKPGWHNSHEEPFSVAGDGSTFAEPASLNMARGAEPT
jgi:hypothetical protein